MKRMPPAMSIEARENQLISLSMDVAEQQLRAGTASAQVITHFIKLGTVSAQLEKEKLARENLLLEAKVESMKSSRSSEETYQEVIKSMMEYSGHGGDEEYE